MSSSQPVEPGLSHYRLTSRDGTIVEFWGEEIGAGSSESPQKMRWAEIKIYRTQAEKLVAHVTAHSRVRGEVTRFDVHVVKDVQTLIEVLSRPSDNGPYLTWPAIRALDEAAEEETQAFVDGAEDWAPWTREREAYVGDRESRGRFYRREVPVDVSAPAVIQID